MSGHDHKHRVAAAGAEPAVRGQGHGHDGEHGHGHSHGTVDPAILESREGVRVLLISLAILGATAIFQAIVVAYTGSVALLADTIHNVGDALTAVPLAAAFILARRPPSRRYTYGLGRTEDLAGLFIVAAITFSAVVALYQSILRLVDPTRPSHLLAGVVAGIVGVVGNELVAVYRIRQGRRMGSAALIADGYHARVDGLASLAVVIGLGAVWLGLDIADPIVGILVSLLIFSIAFNAARDIGRRILDGIEPELVDAVRRAATTEARDDVDVRAARARWIGHAVHAEVDVAPHPGTTSAELIGLRKRIERRLHEDSPRIQSLSVNVVETA